MDKEQVIKSTQEQATAAWIDSLNQLRINTLIERLNAQDRNFEEAMSTLERLKQSIQSEVIDRNRGGEKGMHGFIAERAQVAIENAKMLIQGEAGYYYLVDDNGPVDYFKDGVPIQQKYVQAGGYFSIKAIQKHSETYPEFVKNGGKYQIPKDFYEEIETLRTLPADQAGKLSRPEYTRWKMVYEFFAAGEITPDDLEPADLTYDEVQLGEINKTIAKKAKDIKKADESIRRQAFDESRPTIEEGAKASAVSAALEGGTAFCLAYAKKRKSGKKVSEFTEEDWKEIGIDTGTGAVKGGIRGAAVYTLTNFTATPANVASSFVTAVYGVTAQAAALHRKEISEEDFLINSETICLDVTISAISSLLGQTLIPIPILGAIVGNTTGMILYDIAKNYGSKKEQLCIAEYRQGIVQLNEALDAQYQQLVILLEQRFAQFQSLTEMAFSLDVNMAFASSIGLAYFCGVPEEKILKSKADIDAYFLR